MLNSGRRVVLGGAVAGAVAVTIMLGCTSFSADTVSLAEGGPESGGALEAASLEGGRVDAERGDTGSSDVVAEDHFDSTCGSWTLSGTQVTQLANGRNGSAGACRVCNVPGAAEPTFLSRVLPNPGGSLAGVELTVTIYARATTDAGLDPSGVGFQFSGGALDTAATALGIPGSDWTVLTKTKRSPDRTKTVLLTFELNGPSTRCVDIDDLLVTVSP